MLKTQTLQADLCVVGGGIAGLCAAVEAARHGLKTVLMHERPVLGGNASSEIRMWICGAHGWDNRETGLIEEIALENLYRNPTKNYYLWDTVLYSLARREKNLTLLLNCACMDAETETGDFPDGRTVRIKSVTGYQLTTQQFRRVEARFFADCSGDSILAPLTGAEFRIGRESGAEFRVDPATGTADSCTMGMSCLIQGRETSRPVPFTPPEWSTRLTAEDLAGRLGDPRSTVENYWYLELGGDRDSIGDTEAITEELIPLALGTWDYLKNSGRYDTSTWDLDFLGFLPGKRESRRMVGEYMVTQRDISGGRQYPDTVAYGGWPLDDHFPGGFYHRGTPNTNVWTPAPYPLPYRALYSRNVENLFFAGRNISATHFAMSSTRVMMTCALFGQAVGAAAAVAVAHDLTPHGVYKEQLHALQQMLLNDDCFLPGFRREISDACRRAEISGGSDALRDGRDRVHGLYGGSDCGCRVKNGASVVYRLAEPAWVEAVHLVFDSDLNRESLPGDEMEQYHPTRCSTLLDSPQMHMPLPLCRAFTLTAETDDGPVVLAKVKDNRLRSYDVPVGRVLGGITLVPESNWGGGEETAVFSFDFR